MRVQGKWDGSAGEMGWGCRGNGMGVRESFNHSGYRLRQALRVQGQSKPESLHSPRYFAIDDNT